MDFLWAAELRLSKSPQDAAYDFKYGWHEKEFGRDLAPALTVLRLHYYDIPYMRAEMPAKGRWRGARAEHLIQHLTQELLKNYGKAIQNGEDQRTIKGFEREFQRAT